jgi:hypothetical protein
LIIFTPLLYHDPLSTFIIISLVVYFLFILLTICMCALLLDQDPFSTILIISLVVYFLFILLIMCMRADMLVVCTYLDSHAIGIHGGRGRFGEGSRSRQVASQQASQSHHLSLSLSLSSGLGAGWKTLSPEKTPSAGGG